MINKRLLIKNLLAHHDENSFYDKKRQLNLHTKEGKAKFLKHICALSNSNPTNNAYIVVGVEDQDNTILGDDFFDDSRIQNLVNAYLENPPKIQYENVPFPDLPKDKVVGLVTIFPKKQASFFKKGIYTILAGSYFMRNGSNTMPLLNGVPPWEDRKKLLNTGVVAAIEGSSHNNISQTLDGVMDFMNVRHGDMNRHYKVFKELFVICWAGIPKRVRENVFLSRVDIELINEQVKLFYSTLDEVIISYDDDSFTIVEFVPMGLNDKTTYYPLERTTLRFFENGYYKFDREFLFEPPQYNRNMLFHIYNSNLALLQKLDRNTPLSARELRELENLPPTLMICHLNGFEDAKEKLINAKPLLKPFPAVYIMFKESMRILRKMKYDKA
jgi:hypothetical protein